MANLETLKTVPFKKGKDERRNLSGRPKGSKNRATVYERLLKMKIDVADPSNPKEKVKVSLYEAAALGQIKAAMNGNANAWREIQDSIHGKIKDELDITSNGETILTKTIKPKTK